ncbi:MAG: glycosyltransferase [Bacteroidales bacterium]|nr:glycosyltransferase [Bacteroidales bacterium]
MSVYNAEKYVGDCIRSILGQTFADFEFIIINDASTDNSPRIIKSFKDKRIRLLNNRERSYPTRNKGLRVAKGKYICIMDADDISLPHRFERQVLFMDNNPEFGLAGSGYRVLGQDQDLFRESDYDKIKVQLMRNNCFIHPSVIVRHDMLKKHKLKYIRKYYYSSDYNFIAKAARYFPVTNIPEVLMHYRVHEGQVTIQFRKRQAELADEISLEQVKYSGINPTEDEARLHIALLHGQQIDYSNKDKLFEWLEKIKAANRKVGFYSEVELESFFDSLLSLQPFCLKTAIILPEIKKDKKNNKTDLLDVTFTIPLRIDSKQTIENTNTVIKYLNQHFKTNICILEADIEQRYFPEEIQNNLNYKFIEDKQEIFHRTKWINRFISMATTPYVAVWDTDVISPAEQIIDAVKILRSGDSVLSFPYDGRSYSCDKVSSDLFKRILDIEIFMKLLPAMPLMYGYHSTGGAFLTNKEKYLAAGGENEKFYGWGPEDAERLKRLEIMNLTIHHSEGPLFHLWHPRGKTSRYSDNNIEIQNRREFIETCKKSKFK